MNVKKPPFILIIAVSLHLEYSSSSRVRLFFSLSFFCTEKVEVVREVRGIFRVLFSADSGTLTHALMIIFEFSIPNGQHKNPIQKSLMFHNLGLFN